MTKEINADKPSVRHRQARRILLCVTGLSPQIVTETVFALSVSQATKWIPDEVRLITTQRGADNARLMLLSKNPGWFHRLCNEWNLPAIAFEESHIEVLQNLNGEPLQDIKDDEDNRRAADGIADLVRRMTEVEQLKRRGCLDVVQQRGNVLAHVMVARSAPELVCVVLIMRQRPCGDVFDGFGVHGHIRWNLGW